MLSYQVTSNRNTHKLYHRRKGWTLLWVTISFLHNNYDVLLWTWAWPTPPEKETKTVQHNRTWQKNRGHSLVPWKGFFWWLKNDHPFGESIGDGGDFGILKPEVKVSLRFMVSQPGFGESFLGTSRKSTKNLVKRTSSPMVWISQRLMGDDGWHETQLNERSSILSFTEKVGKKKTKHIQN